MDRLQYEAFVNAYLDYRCFNTTSSRAIYEKAFRQVFNRKAISIFLDTSFKLDDVVEFNDKWRKIEQLLIMVGDSIASSNSVYSGIVAFAPPNIARTIEKNIVASIDRKSKNKDSIEVLVFLLKTARGFLEAASVNKYFTTIQELIFVHFKHLIDVLFTDDKEYNKVVCEVIEDAIKNTPIEGENIEYWAYSSSVIKSATNILASKITDSITSSMMMSDDDEFYKETFKETVESLKIVHNDFLKRANKIENSASNFLSNIGFTNTLLNIELHRSELIEKELNVPYQFEFSFSSQSFYRQGFSLTLTSSLNQLKDYISSVKKGNLSQLEAFNGYYEGSYTLNGDIAIDETLRAIGEFYEKVLKKYVSCSTFIDKDKLIEFITNREEDDTVLTKFYNYKAKTFLGDTDFTVTVSVKEV